MTLNPGDVVMVEQTESGQLWFARVDHVSKGGRAYLEWFRREKDRGSLTKPRPLDPNRERVVRAARPSEAARFGETP